VILGFPPWKGKHCSSTIRVNILNEGYLGSLARWGRVSLTCGPHLLCGPWQTAYSLSLPQGYNEDFLRCTYRCWHGVSILLVAHSTRILAHLSHSQSLHWSQQVKHKEPGAQLCFSWAPWLWACLLPLTGPQFLHSSSKALTKCFLRFLQLWQNMWCSSLGVKVPG
jgi:hypothetical protein